MSFYLYQNFVALLLAVGVWSFKTWCLVLIWDFLWMLSSRQFVGKFLICWQRRILTLLFGPVIQLCVVWWSLFCLHLYLLMLQLETWMKERQICKIDLHMEMKNHDVGWWSCSVILSPKFGEVASMCVYTSSLNARSISPWELFSKCSFACILYWACLPLEEETVSRVNHRLSFG
jgi:hypothetical protein